MKTRLLRKLRKQISLEERNGKYRIFDHRPCSGGVYNKTDWKDKCSIISERRDWILREAQRYLKPKKIIL